jgi:hypothetical protein
MTRNSRTYSRKKRILGGNAIEKKKNTWREEVDAIKVDVANNAMAR